MANRRMLSKFVFENDDFLDMPAESQALYAHLVINADDDGFAAGTGAFLCLHLPRPVGGTNE